MGGKTVLAAALAAVLSVCGPSAARTPADTSVTEDSYGPEVERKNLTFYVGAMDSWIEEPVCFINGVDDIPYIDLNDWADFLTAMHQDYAGDAGYSLTVETDDSVVLLERENGYQMLVDFEAGTIQFDDYDAFLHDSGSSALLDTVTNSSLTNAGGQDLFNRLDQGSFDRYGSEVFLDLSKYEIRIYYDDEGYYVPLQTLNDFLLAIPFQMNALYNGKAVIVAGNEDIGDPNEGYTELGEYYYSAEPSERSADLAHYCYCELCLALDCLYGQKEIHEIHGFDSFFGDTGYKEYLLDTDPVTADLALEEFINYYLDDLHSGFCGYSWLCGTAETEENQGLANTRYDELYELFYYAREQIMGDEIPGYEEIGNTAYITFDEFNCNDSAAYFEYPEEIDISEDTIALVIYAHEQINRKDSPVENVVIDLSCNTGGTVDAAAFLIAWYLGQAELTIKDTFTGAVSTAIYEADVNLDGVFDNDDNILDRNLYCLISPVSFSCGNLVPSAFKSSHLITLLGRATGGGSCMVLPLSTACGSMFQISAPLRMSAYKNGSNYDIDRGIEPDYTINNIANYYDREALTDYINGLF